LAILCDSFRLLARALLPLAVLFILSACGGAKRQEAHRTQGVRGAGFTALFPAGWRVHRPADGVVARHAGELVSVTAFPLLKPYDPADFAAAARELDHVAARLARQAGEPLASSATVTVANRKVRAYRYGPNRIGFVLVGKREYQLFCARATTACDLLFSSFTLTGPQAR
jgi:hypothetical protein